MVNAIKAAFGFFLIKMIVRLINGIKDTLIIQLFFAYLLVIFFPNHHALCLQNGTGRTKVSTPSRNRAKSERSKKMTTIVGHHYAFKATRRR